MKIFLSWSGSTSHAIAEKLHKWLPMVIQKLEPYISTEIEKGTRWGTDIAQELEQCSFGIACVTTENKDAPWLLFEAGALSKSVSEGRLAPVLFGLDQSDVQKSPLTQFQMTKFEKAEFLRLLQSINDSLEVSLDSGILSNLFDALWPRLESEVSDILSKAGPTETANQNFDADKIMGAMEELLTNSRAISQVVSRPDRLLPEDYLEFVLRRTSRHDIGKLDSRRIDSLLSRSMSLLAEARESVGEDTKGTIERVMAWLDETRFLAREFGYRTQRPRRLGSEPLGDKKDEGDSEEGKKAS